MTLEKHYRQPGESVNDCVAANMKLMAQEPKYAKLSEKAKLGRAFGMCEEAKKADTVFTTQSSGAYHPTGKPIMMNDPNKKKKKEEEEEDMMMSEHSVNMDTQIDKQNYCEKCGKPIKV